MVARSQARRICNRLEEFKEVILDFQDVEYMGQGFADEVFKVIILFLLLSKIPYIINFSCDKTDNIVEYA